MQIGMGLYVRQRLTQQVMIAMPQIQWSLVQAYKSGQSEPPPFVPPTFEEEVFEPRLKLTRRTIPGFEALDHVRRMQAVDDANAIFRFAYTRGSDRDNKEKGYYKIPLLRDRNEVAASCGTSVNCFVRAPAHCDPKWRAAQPPQHPCHRKWQTGGRSAESCRAHR